MKALAALEVKNLDEIATKEYVDGKIAKLSKDGVENEAIKDKIRFDLASHLIGICIMSDNNEAVIKQTMSTVFKESFDKNGIPLSEKYDLTLENRANILDIIAKERDVYVDPSKFLEGME